MFKLKFFFGPKTVDRVLSDFNQIKADLAELTTDRMAAAIREREEVSRHLDRAVMLEAEANRAERVRLRLEDIFE